MGFGRTRTKAEVIVNHWLGIPIDVFMIGNHEFLDIKPEVVVDDAGGLSGSPESIRGIDFVPGVYVGEVSSYVTHNRN